MGISATELAEAPPEQVEAPEGKKLVGRSPTQIALQRPCKDKLAVFCMVIVAILVLAAIFASERAATSRLAQARRLLHGHRGDRRARRDLRAGDNPVIEHLAADGH